MDHGGFQLFDDARHFPPRVQVELGAWPKANQIVSFGRAPGELTLRMRHEHRPMSTLAQSKDGKQNLPLAAAPGSGRVDVEGEHRQSSIVNRQSSVVERWGRRSAS